MRFSRICQGKTHRTGMGNSGFDNGFYEAGPEFFGLVIQEPAPVHLAEEGGPSKLADNMKGCKFWQVCAMLDLKHVLHIFFNKSIILLC